VSKKRPLDQYAKEHQIDLQITGERKLEGGQRSISHKSCFEEAKRGDKFMPLFWWSDEVKAAFKETEGIRYSDCYEVYGLRRTGCVGCPFNSTVNADLKVMQKYEPGLFKACMNVFGQSYKLMDEFSIRKMRVLDGLEV
jgi:3'-phosphoadenosine 5'-phosphosulfate sulfotransferase (PAPS reductase)/FAD synthetase